VSVDEEDYLRQVNRLLKRDLPVQVVKGFEPNLSERRSSPRSRTRTASSRPGRPAARSARGRSAGTRSRVA
jgi:hypothetical protein